MARPLRIEFPGALYHVTARGAKRGDIYLDDADREQFLVETIRTAMIKFKIFHGCPLIRVVKSNHRDIFSYPENRELLLDYLEKKVTLMLNIDNY